MSTIDLSLYIFPQTPVLPQTLDLDRNVHPTCQISTLCPPDFIPSKPHPTFRPRQIRLSFVLPPSHFIHIRHRTNQKVRMPSSHRQSANNVKVQGNVLPTKYRNVCPEHLVDEPHDIEFKTGIINSWKN